MFRVGASASAAHAPLRAVPEALGAMRLVAAARAPTPLVCCMQRAWSMKMLTTTAAALLLLLSAACGERARFRPTQNVNAVSPSGKPAASYELRAYEGSDAKITVNVWSEGAERHDDRTTVDLAVELRNTSDDAIQLDRDAVALEAFNTKGSPLPAARLASVAAEKGSETVAPRSASTLRLKFELAVPVAPTEVGALRLRWGVVRGDGERYVQFTEFRQQQEQLAMAGDFYYDPIYGFYDPFFYGAPYGYHLNYYVPVRRVIVGHRTPPMLPRR